MLCSFLVLGLSHTTANHAAVSGRLYVTKGRAYVVGKSDQAAQLVQVCRTNDTIEVAPHSSATIWLVGSGLRYQLSSPSTVKIVNGSVVAIKGLSPKSLPKLGSGITTVFQNSTAQAAVQVRDGDSISVTPTGGLTKAPEAISWEKLPNATSFDVSLVDEATSAKVYQAEAITSNSFLVPPGRLVPGKQYRLTIATNLPNGGCTFAFRSLRILSPIEISGVKRTEQAFEAILGSSSEVDLAKADLLEQYGLYKDSLQSLMRLQMTTPSPALTQEITRVKGLAEGRS